MVTNKSSDVFMVKPWSHVCSTAFTAQGVMNGGVGGSSRKAKVQLQFEKDVSIFSVTMTVKSEFLRARQTPPERHQVLLPVEELHHLRMRSLAGCS